MVLRNWAIFVEGDSVKWTYGLANEISSRGHLGPDSDANEFQQTTVRFIQSLQAIGRELYSEGVASIKLAHPSRSALIANEIFIVNLSDQFFFIISDLTVTARLIATEAIPYELEQVICAVLVGQAAVLYSNLILVQETAGYDTDQIFQDILKALEIDKRFDLADLVADGRCSLSPLNMTELLLFHYLLREYFEQKSHLMPLSSKAWAIMVDTKGTDIPLSWLSPKDPYLLGNFLGAIYSYVQGLFGTKPAAIVFGGHELIYLRFFGGTTYFLAASNPAKLVNDKEFIDHFTTIPAEKVEDIINPIKEFLVDLIIQHLSYTLRKNSLSLLLPLAQALETSILTISPLSFTEIPGIGEKIAHQLKKAGIASLREFVDISPTDLIQLLSSAKSFSPQQVRTWQKKARALLETKGDFIISFKAKTQSKPKS